MDAQIWLLRDQTSPEKKVWGLIVVEGAAFTFYGGTITPRIIVSRVDRKKGLARLAEKQKKYGKCWQEKLEIPEGKAVDEFCEELYNVFFKVGRVNENVIAFLQQHRSKAPDRQAAAARERANKRISAAIQKVPTLPWAF
jgi:hypothetical protein